MMSSIIYHLSALALDDNQWDFTWASFPNNPNTTRAATGRAFHFGKVYRSQQGSAATNTRLNTSGVPSENRGFQCRRHCGEGM